MSLLQEPRNLGSLLGPPGSWTLPHGNGGGPPYSPLYRVLYSISFQGTPRAHQRALQQKWYVLDKGSRLWTPTREPEEYTRNMKGVQVPAPPSTSTITAQLCSKTPQIPPNKNHIRLFLEVHWAVLIPGLIEVPILIS